MLVTAWGRRVIKMTLDRFLFFSDSGPLSEAERHNLDIPG